MASAQAVLYLLGVLLLILGSNIRPAQVSLGMLGAASLALGFTLPAIGHLFGS